MKNKLIKLHWFLATQLGLDLILLINAIRALPWFLVDFFKFRSILGETVKIRPCLHDRKSEAGTISNEYAIQDLMVAQEIFGRKPRRHLDIGSRLDGFVSNVASFREIEVLDVRPMTTFHQNIKFRQADLMDQDAILSGNLGLFDSISCLHALEHFGLGRYGDPLNPNGWKLGLGSFSTLLEPGGHLYLSTPIGVHRVEFNANWVFDPRLIISAALERHLVLKDLWLIFSGKEPTKVDVNDDVLHQLASKEYTLGLFIFVKKTQTLN